MQRRPKYVVAAAKIERGTVCVALPFCECPVDSIHRRKCQNYIQNLCRDHKIALETSTVLHTICFLQEHSRVLAVQNCGGKLKSHAALYLFLSYQQLNRGINFANHEYGEAAMKKGLPEETSCKYCLMYSCVIIREYILNDQGSFPSV